MQISARRLVRVVPMPILMGLSAWIVQKGALAVPAITIAPVALVAFTTTKVLASVSLAIVSV